MRTRAIRSLGLLPLLLLGAACGKGGGGGSASSAATATDANAPVITNLRVSYGAGCTLSSIQARGTIEIVSFDYVDADGNLRGGVVNNRTTFPTQAPITFTGSLPSRGVTISGTTSGTVSITACLLFGGSAGISEEVQVTDVTGKVSNVLALEVSHPAGLPQVPRGGDDAVRKSLEFSQ